MTFDIANRVLKDQEADLIAFGSLFIANDNLVDKFRSGEKLNDIKYCDKNMLRKYWFAPIKEGYLDLSMFEPPKWYL